MNLLDPLICAFLHLADLGSHLGPVLETEYRGYRSRRTTYIWEEKKLEDQQKIVKMDSFIDLFR